MGKIKYNTDEERKEARRKSIKKYNDKVKRLKQLDYRNNKEKYKEKNKKYYEDNKENILKNVKEYDKNNKNNISNNKKTYYSLYQCHFNYPLLKYAKSIYHFGRKY